ncbi:hypothetical protein BACCOPRO_01018 [Phocaeicola coprophilus DSM 18228 = JCM 13818]|uniref:Uncharacterized protein n=1 Tax=Phocaeicola coprophilus DSM 18228 = JCM 13818 TaxID=547042 RepID=S0F5R6_9BACT|nr:hypothetical protein BACCOPRO_01018 [Phocaeicola coprophilus DSM 18228 = JCM 13818]
MFIFRYLHIYFSENFQIQILQDRLIQHPVSSKLHRKALHVLYGFQQEADRFPYGSRLTVCRKSIDFL